MPTADVYTMFSQLQAGMMEIKLHLERVDVEHRQKSETVADHEARLRVIEATGPGQFAGDVSGLTARLVALERFRYTLAGGLALVALVFSALGAWLVSALTHQG